MHQGTIYSKGTYWVFVLVSVKPGVYNTTKQILEQTTVHSRFKCENTDVQTSAKNTWKIMANPCAVIIPWRAPTKTVFWGSSLGAAHFT